jgi:hypothetical protein
MDCLSTKVMPAQRLLDIMDANAQVQTKLRRDQSAQ